MGVQKFKTKKPAVLPSEKWKICIEEPFLNCEKIYPVQQKKVAELVNALKNNESIGKIVIFGSSVSERCHSGSDIDAYIVSEQENIKKPCLSFSCDLWTAHTVGGRMLDEIKKKGVTVYEK